jgi:hypothetical protein
MCVLFCFSGEPRLIHAKGKSSALAYGCISSECEYKPKWTVTKLNPYSSTALKNSSKRKCFQCFRALTGTSGHPLEKIELKVWNGLAHLVKLLKGELLEV